MPIYACMYSPKSNTTQAAIIRYGPKANADALPWCLWMMMPATTPNAAAINTIIGSCHIPSHAPQADKSLASPSPMPSCRRAKRYKALISQSTKNQRPLQRWHLQAWSKPQSHLPSSQSCQVAAQDDRAVVALDSRCLPAQDQTTQRSPTKHQ